MTMQIILKKNLTAVSAVVLGLMGGSCGEKKISDRTGTARFGTFPTGTQVSTTETANGVQAVLDPNSTSAQLVSLTSGALNGLSVAFPVGSLSIPMTVTISQGVAVSGATLLQNLGITGNTVKNSGVPVEIAASAAVDLRSPMVLAIPIPTGTGLVGTTTDRSRLAVLYRVKVAQGDTSGNYTGIVPATSLGYDNGKVLFETKFFGWYSVVALENPAPAAVEVKANYADQITAKMFAPPPHLPAWTSAHTNRIAYVAAPTDGKYWVYCNGSAWIAVTKNPMDVTIPPPSSQPIRLLRQSDSSEIGRVVNVSTNWKLLVKGSLGNTYLVETALSNSTDILPTDIAGLSKPTRTGVFIGFSDLNCTGTGYYYYGPSISWPTAPLYLYDSSSTSAVYNGWYRYTSTASTTPGSMLSYFDEFSTPRCTNSPPNISSAFTIEKLTETLPIPNSGAWKVE